MLTYGGGGKGGGGGLMIPFNPPYTPTTTQPSSVAAGVILDPILDALRGDGSTGSGTIPVSYGKRLVNGRVIWIGELKPDTSSSGCNTNWLATFAVGFGYSMMPRDERGGVKITRAWANNVEMVEFFTLIYNLHDGAQWPPEPDPVILEAMGEDALTYPEMIYVVFKDFPLWKVQAATDTTVPDITVELWDHASDDDAVNLLSSLNPDPAAYDQGMIVDWDDGVFYTFGSSSGNFATTEHVYDIETQAEIREVALDMNGLPAAGFRTQTTMAYDKRHRLAFTNGDIFNSEPVVCFDVKTGKAKSVFGAASSDTDNGAASFAKTFLALAVQCKEGQGTYNALVQLSSFLDYGLLTYNDDGTGLVHAGHGTLDIGFSKISGDTLRCMMEYPVDAPIADKCTTSTAVTKTDAYVLVGAGHMIYMIRVGARNGVVQLITSPFSGTTIQQFYTALPTHTFVDAIIRDPTNGDIVAFLSDRDDATKSYAARIKVTVDKYFNASFGSRPVPHGWPVYTKEIPEVHPRLQDAAFRYSRMDGDTFVYPSGDKYIFLNLATGSYVESPTVTTNYAPATSDYFFDGRVVHLPTGVVPYPSGDEGPVRIQFGSVDGELVTLSDALRWYCLAVDFDEDDIYVDPALTDKFPGGIITAPTDLWQLMPDLAKVMNFIYFMSEGVLKFVRIGSGPDSTALFHLTEDDLAQVEGGSGLQGVFEGMSTVDPAPNELPGEASISFINLDQDYTVDSATFHRNFFPARTKRGRTTTTYAVPIILTTLDAQARAMRLAYEPEATMRTSTLRLGKSFYLYEPGDPGVVVTNGQEIQLRLQEMVFNGDWSVSVSCSDDRFSTSFAPNGTLPDGTGDPTHPPPPDVDPTDPPVDPPDPGSFVSDSGILLLDTNLIAIEDEVPSDESTVYVGATRRGTTWTGATVFVNGDPLGHTSTVTTVGYVAGALPDEPLPWMTHEDYDIDVTLPADQTLEGVTDEEFLAGTNAALVGDDGRWELIFWRDVTQLTPSQWELSHIARGRRGTEIHTGSHVAGDTFILLSGVFGVPLPGSDIGESIVAKAEGDITTLPIPTKTLTYAANSKKPWAPIVSSMALGSTINDVGATDYDNSCGGGDFLDLNDSREDLITVTASFTPNQGSLQNLVDGGDGNNSTDAIEIPNGLTNAIITFDFRPSGFKQVMDALTWEQSNSTTQGTYDIEASDDGTSWDSLASGQSLTSGSSVHETTWTNSTGYWFYRVKQVGGTTSNSPWVKEVFFKTMADVGANDVVIRWRRRDRLADNDWLTDPVPMSEDDELYRIEIMSGSTVVRTVSDVELNLYTYLSADQSTDGFSPPLSSLKVQVYQKSGLVGYGHTRAMTVEVEA